MDFWFDVFSSWNNIFTFVLVVILFYGALSLISKIADSSSKVSKSSESYSFHKSNGKQQSSNTIITKVVGVTFNNRQKVIRTLTVGELLELIPEPNNSQDPNAVKVIRKTGEQVGYLDRELAEDISGDISTSDFFRHAKVLKIIGSDTKDQNLGVIIKIYLS